MGLSDIKDIVDIIGTLFGCCQGWLTITAVLAGAYWFFARRLRYPRANIEHIITHKLLPDGKLMLHVAVVISNTGEVLIRFRSAEVRVQQILPLHPELAKRVQSGHNLVKDGHIEVEWPVLASRSHQWGEEREFEIEPSEKDVVPCDFILDSNVEVVEIYTHFTNVRKRRGKPIGWCATTIYDVSKTNELGENDE
ncbi:MAG TPA: hypothetical protein VMY80_05250 [Anaerolineae bacterium]|nr:hypothetical protein [Anaerolineae bacterium]